MGRPSTNENSSEVAQKASLSDSASSTLDIRVDKCQGIAETGEICERSVSPTLLLEIRTLASTWSTATNQWIGDHTYLYIHERRDRMWVAVWIFRLGNTSRFRLVTRKLGFPATIAASSGSFPGLAIARSSFFVGLRLSLPVTDELRRECLLQAI